MLLARAGAGSVLGKPSDLMSGASAKVERAHFYSTGEMDTACVGATAANSSPEIGGCISQGSADVFQGSGAALDSALGCAYLS